jgi:hypothetical protein
MLSVKWQSKLKLSGNGNECKPLPVGGDEDVLGLEVPVHVVLVVQELERQQPGAYTRPLSSSR